MYMPYSTNPNLPKVRREAVRLVCYRGWSMRKVARYIGVYPSTVSRWVKLDPTGGWRLIPTQNSKPHHHPRQLNEETINAVLNYRERHQRCAEVLHHLLLKDGYQISLSSVKRTLRRHGLTRFSKWKKWHQYPPRPIPEKPGILVEIDTIFDGEPKERLYVYTLIDIRSRWSYAQPTLHINTHKSLAFVKGAEAVAPFLFITLQSDHGSEFSKWFTKRIIENGMAHRHSRVRMPSDNGHLERFNRTLQDECLRRIPRNLKSWQKEIPEYIWYYNHERPHMGLDMRTPLEVLRSY